MLRILTRFHWVPLVTTDEPEWQLVQLFSLGAPVYPEDGPEASETTFPTTKTAKETISIFNQRIFKFRIFSHLHKLL